MKMAPVSIGSSISRLNNSVNKPYQGDTRRLDILSTSKQWYIQFYFHILGTAVEQTRFHTDYEQNLADMKYAENCNKTNRERTSFLRVVYVILRLKLI